MDSADRFAERRAKLVRRLKVQSLDALLVTSRTNVSYLSGFSGDDSFLVVGRDHSILLSDSRFTDQIAEECPGLEAAVRRSGVRMDEWVAKALGKLKARRVAFESTSLTVFMLESYQKRLPAVEWVGVAGEVEALRAIKDAGEIRQLKQTARFAETAFEKFRESLRLGDTEKSLADRLDSLIRQAGGRCSSFPPIVAVGPRAALPHAVPTERALGAGDLLLVDWGARGDFYCSDLTRVLAARKISPKLARVYSVVIAAQRRAIEGIRPGVTGAEVDALARGVIEEAGFGSSFTHSTGHGLGLEVHESPSLRSSSEDVLKPGMVVTVEPGVYLKGWGGVRIEDDVLVTRDGFEVLTKTPKDLDQMVAPL
jgi:Xaa-Pro aminopeptidase